MKKMEIVQTLRETESLDRHQAHRIVNLFFDSIAQALKAGDRAEIRGFCSFSVKSYPEYTGRNPKTGEKVVVKEKRLPVIRVGTELRERVDS